MSSFVYDPSKVAGLISLDPTRGRVLAHELLIFLKIEMEGLRKILFEIPCDLEGINNMRKKLHQMIARSGCLGFNSISDLSRELELRLRSCTTNEILPHDREALAHLHAHIEEALSLVDELIRDLAI